MRPVFVNPDRIRALRVTRPILDTRCPELRYSRPQRTARPPPLRHSGYKQLGTAQAQRSMAVAKSGGVVVDGHRACKKDTFLGMIGPEKHAPIQLKGVSHAV